MRLLLVAAALLLLLTAIPAAAADPIEFFPGPRTTLVDTCQFTWPYVDQGVQVYYQPIYFGTFEPLPHADGVVLTAGAQERDC